MPFFCVSCIFVFCLLRLSTIFSLTYSLCPIIIFFSLSFSIFPLLYFLSFAYYRLFLPSIFIFEFYILFRLSFCFAFQLFHLPIIISFCLLLFSFFLDGLKFYAGHILLYSRSWMSSPDWICLTSQPNINRRAATQQISTRLAKLTELIYSNLYD